MKSIQELRTMLQEEKVNPVGWTRPWGYKFLQRGPSIYITRLLISTSIKPNQVTIAGLLIGFFGCWFVLQFPWFMKLAGVLLLYLYLLSDKIDGEIARYKKVYSLKGIYWDEVGHLLIPPLFWLALTFGITKISAYEIRFLLVTGFIGALALVIIRITHSLAPQIYGKKYIKNRHLFPLQEHVPSNKNQVKYLYSGVRTIMRSLHQLQDFLTLLIITGSLIIVERIFFLDFVFHPLIANFVLTFSALFLLFAIENIIRKSLTIEHDVHSIHRQQYTSSLQ